MCSKITQVVTKRNIQITLFSLYSIEYISYFRNQQHYHPSHLGVGVNSNNSGGLQTLVAGHRLGPHSNLIGQSVERNTR